MSIKQLPSDVVAQIKSSVVITSLNTVILGLLRNSLDARADRIKLSVDYGKGTCSVADNGIGIPPAEFREGGGLGNLHCTSRYPPKSDCYGKHGTFLASVASLSLLNISSHHHEYHSTNSLSIHNSKVIARDTPSPPELRLSVFKHGTTVTVHDLFGSMPVRVRQRALEVQKSGSAKEVDDLLLRIIPLLLFCPHHVAYIDVFDTTGTKGSKVASLHTAVSSDTVTGHLPLAHRLRALLSQSSMLDSIGAGSCTKVEASGFGINIQGTVCLDPYPTKRLQFLALGIEPLANDHGANVFHEEVNRVFANSAFGRVEEEYGGLDSEGKESGRTVRVKDLKARRGVDRWPIFALQITFKDLSRKVTLDADEVLDSRSPDLSVITDLLRVVAYQWLKKHHFRPKQPNSVFQQLLTTEEPGTRAGSADGQGSIRRRTSSTSGRVSKETAVDRSCASPFDSWSRVKVGHPMTNVSKLRRPSSAPLLQRKPPLVDANGKLLRKPFDDPETPKAPSTPSPLVQETGTGGRTEDDVFIWVDPVSKAQCTVNGRTGFVMETDAMMDKRITFPPPSKTLKETTPEPAPWIEDMLATWQNPAYAPLEPSIVRVPDPFEVATAPPGRGSACSHVHLGDSTESSTMQLQERVSKTSLRDAIVIAQVDTKFILVKVAPESRSASSADNQKLTSSDSRELLVLIDQHAADERCRVEVLQGAYFISVDTQPGQVMAATEPLDKPLLFEINRQESLLLERFKQHFAHWGINYTVCSRNAGVKQTSSKSKILIDRLPPSILERCRVEPRVLIELMRKEIWRLRDGSDVPTTAHQAHADGGEPGDNDWVRRFHGCPQGILDLIFSRACRSAIMFNDELSMEECRDLVLRLSGCVFPFQCAHGRPSMAPVVDLGGSSGFGAALPGESRDGTVMASLRRWKDGLE